MTIQIVEASPQAKARIASYEDKIGVNENVHHRTKYPFEQMKIGECFTIPFEEASDATLRVIATNKSKKLNKRFIVIKHKDFACIEVTRIA